MLSNLRNYSKIIIIIVAIAMVASGVLYGSLYGFGAFSQSDANNSSTPANIAKVNGSNISQQEYYTVLRNQIGTNNLTRSQEIPFKYNVLNSIISRKLILQQADKLGVKPEVSEKDVNEYINKILENNDMTEEELISYLEERESTLKELKNSIKKDLEINSRIEQVQEDSYKNITVSEDEIADSYEKVKVQAVVKRFSDDKVAAKNSINEAMNKINGGSDFATVAKDYTDFNTVDLGMIGRENSSLPGKVLKEAFELKKDSVSNVIEGESAYYIVKVLDKKLASGEDYENAREEIKNNILEEKQNKAFSNWLENIKAESDIAINDPLLNGYKAYTNGNYGLAISELEKAMENYPAPMTYVYMAQAYNSNEQTDKAIETYDKALEEYPNDWELHYNYASLLIGQEETDQEKVVSLLDKASSLAGDDFMAHYQLYMAYYQAGAEEKAKVEYEKINELQKKMQEEQKAQEDNKQNSGDSQESANNESDSADKSSDSENK